MKKELQIIAAAFILISLAGCQSRLSTPVVKPINPEPVKIAFLADVHFHDVYGQLRDNKYQGLPTQTPKGENKALIRSMAAQLHSTRLFNENYFVFINALNDLVAKQVRWVALPGDFSDDGQSVHIRGLVKILAYYQQKHGMRFFAIPGNHDPVRPFTTASGKKDFLAHDGSEIGIYGKQTAQCENGETANLICSDELNKWGYKEIMTQLADFGFWPSTTDLHFETPFPQANANNFAYEERAYTWCSKNNKNNCIRMPDASYLVEPINGLWLLAIDANIYAPKDPNKLSNDGNSFNGSSNAGYNALLEYKPELLDWIKDVVQRANQQGKQLIAFSHFPMADFYDMAQDDIEFLFGKGKHQTARMPLASTTAALASTGLKVHVGGHMHINDTATVKTPAGDTLFNIQAPTLAAYRPAYKLLTLHHNIIDVDTVVLDKVARFRELFPHYRKEHSYLTRYKPTKLWSKSILAAKNYGEFTDQHLQQLIKLRYLPREWPVELVDWLTSNSVPAVVAQFTAIQVPKSLRKANGLALINDFYRLRNADSIAEVSALHQTFYLTLHQALEQSSDFKQKHIQQFALMMKIMAKFINAQPSDNIRLHLNEGRIEALP